MGLRAHKLLVSGRNRSQNEEESSTLIVAKKSAIEAQVKVIEDAERASKEAEEKHSSLQSEYQGMCAGVATEKEDSRTLTDQV